MDEIIMDAEETHIAGGELDESPHDINTSVPTYLYDFAIQARISFSTLMRLILRDLYAGKDVASQHRREVTKKVKRSKALDKRMKKVVVLDATACPYSSEGQCTCTLLSCAHEGAYTECQAYLKETED